MYPEELVTTHRDDREYLAAEATAFLIFVLSRTGATVINAVADGALGDDAIRPERWLRVAGGMGVKVAPLRLRPGQRLRRPTSTATVEVVGRESFGGTAPRLRKAATELAETLGLTYAACVFDGRGVLISVSTMKPPGAEATVALGGLLGMRRGR